MLKIEQSVKDLRNSLQTMLELVEKMVNDIKVMLNTEDLSGIERTFEQDTTLDSLEKKLDDQAIALLALVSPMATDLRFVFSVIKLNVDLERMGDECKNVAKELRNVKLPLPDEIKQLSIKVFEMVRDSFIALRDENTTLAREIVLRDDEVDKLEYHILQKYTQSIGIAFAAKALERISDHATNICENVIYVIDGVDIRHENTIMKRLGKN